MKTPRFLVPSTVVCAALAFALLPATSDAAIVSVDFEQSTGNPTQAGFEEWVITGDDSTVVSKSFGSISATLAGGSAIAALEGTGTAIRNTRDRGLHIADSGAYTQAALMRDRIVTLGAPTNPTTGLGTGIGLYLRLAGFEPLTAYTIQVWGVDHTATGELKSGYVYLFDATNEASGYTSLPSLGNYVVGSTSPGNSGITTIPDNNAFSVTATVTTDATGTMIVKSISNIDGSGIMNGFTVVPEPSTVALGILGSLALLASRRRRV